MVAVASQRATPVLILIGRLSAEAPQRERMWLCWLPEVGDGAWWTRPGWGPIASSMRARRGPSHKATDRRPSKKLKCEKRGLAKLELQGANIRGSTSRAPFSKEPTERLPSEASLPECKTMLQSEGKAIPQVTEEVLGNQGSPCAKPLEPGTGGCFPKAGEETLFQPCIQNVEEEEEEEDEDEEESYGAGLSDDSEMEPEEMQNQVVEFDNSAFWNEDSNQPLPVDRFFGSVAFMQDLPAAPLTQAVTSRREFRKAHFIAKDDEEEEEVL